MFFLPPLQLARQVFCTIVDMSFLGFSMQNLLQYVISFLSVDQIVRTFLDGSSDRSLFELEAEPRHEKRLPMVDCLVEDFGQPSNYIGGSRPVCRKLDCISPSIVGMLAL